MNLAKEVRANRKWHHIWCPSFLAGSNKVNEWVCRRCDRRTINRAHQALTICHFSPKMKQNYAAQAALGML